MHDFTTHHLHTVFCVHHPKSSPLPSPFIPPVPPPRNMLKAWPSWPLPHGLLITVLWVDIMIPVAQRAPGKFTWSLSQHMGNLNPDLSAFKGLPRGPEHGQPCCSTPTRCPMSPFVPRPLRYGLPPIRLCPATTVSIYCRPVGVSHLIMFLA